VAVTAGERDARLRREDAEARVLARSVFDRPFLLEAGAGTGKTTALVTRILAWCLGPGWERAAAARGAGAADEAVAEEVLRRVLAITFTEAAAAKMGEEVERALFAIERGALPAWLEAAALPPPPARGARARALRGALDHLGVHTIHAWCRRLLALYPLEAGLHPRLEIDADQKVQEEIAREVLEEMLGAAYAEPGVSDALALAAAGAGPRELELELLALLESGMSAADLAEPAFAPARLERLRRRALAQVEACAAAGAPLRAAPRSTTGVEVVTLLHALREKLAAPWPDPAALERVTGWLRDACPEGHRKRLAEWAKGTFNKTEAAALGEACSAVSAAAAPLARLLPHLAALDPSGFERARRVVGALLDEIEARLRRRGAATFSELLTGAERLVRAHPEVAAQVRRGIDQLLVDEFQDTDRRQCDILRAVALSGPAEARPGLFLVGDPKQSIYGWRSADLAAYDAFAADLERAGGSVHRLSVNFRSVPAVLREVETVIAPAMRREPGLQPEFQPLVASPAREADPGFGEDGRAPIEYWVSARWDAAAGAPIQTRAAEAARIEAAAVARDLLALHEAGVAWRRVALLFRGRADFEIYLSELRAAQIPYAVEGDRGYYRRREVIEAAAIVRCVLDPGDQLALLTALRSSVVGVPDAALIPLWAADLPARIADLTGFDGERPAQLAAIFEAVAASLPDEVPGLARIRGWQANARAFCTAVATLRRSFREEPADVFVERLRALTLLEATEAARFLGAWRTANLDRFFRELAHELGASPDPHAVLRRLRRAVAEEEPREEGVPQDLAEDAIQILTIHGAKGLDFEHVYLLQLHKGRGRDLGARPDPGRAPDGTLEYRLLELASPGWDEVSRERARVEEAERVRTLYVAMTRAERRLVLAGVWPGLQSRGGGGGSLVELVHAARPQGAPGPRWVFPAQAADAKAAAARPRRDDGLPALAACAAQARALEVARAAGADRERRRFGGAASELAAEEKLGDAADRRSEAPGPRAAAAAAVARAVGTAIHRVLEELDLAAEPAAELARQHAALPALVRSAADAAYAPAALREARELLDRIAGGALLARLRGLRDAVAFRELPVLLPAEGDDGPAAFVSGVADLVYRDPETGEWVVVDYKTDRAAEDLAPEQLAAYRAQGAVYQRALRDALGLERLPRFELWLLRADRALR
jgi:ATP-dependent helicase/nuclease subunit A